MSSRGRPPAASSTACCDALGDASAGEPGAARASTRDQVAVAEDLPPAGARTSVTPSV